MWVTVGVIGEGVPASMWFPVCGSTWFQVCVVPSVDFQCMVPNVCGSSVWFPMCVVLSLVTKCAHLRYLSAVEKSGDTNDKRETVQYFPGDADEE